MKPLPRNVIRLVLPLLFVFPSVPNADQSFEKMPRDFILTSDENGVPKFAHGNLGHLEVGVNRGAAAEKFLEGFSVNELGAVGDEQFVTRHVLRDDQDNFHARVIQTVRGLQVVGATLIVHARSDGSIFSINGEFVSSKNLPRVPQLPSNIAVAQAAAEAGIKGEFTGSPELVYVLADNGQTYLAWQSRVTYYSSEGPEIDLVFADAITGSLVARHPQVHRAKNWRTYDYDCPDTYILQCTNGGTCSDPVLRDTHDNASLTYDYYKSVFNRNSWNDSDAIVKSAGHFVFSCSGGGVPPDNPPDTNPQAVASNESDCNAFWINPYMVFGDCDGVLGSPKGADLDWVVHEFTHGVTEEESGLIGFGESGAINEAVSDIFAAGADAHYSGNTGDHVWQVGEDSYTPGISGDASRYMANPTQDGESSDYYPERYTGTGDNGGVHRNAGIINLAFYLLSEGGYHPRGKTSTKVHGVGIDEALGVYYHVQRYYITASTKMPDLPDLMWTAAQNIFFNKSCPEQQSTTVPLYESVKESLCAVGLCMGTYPPPGTYIPCNPDDGT